MVEEINANRFLEHGEHNGNLYGTHLDSIRDVIKQGNDRCTLHTQSITTKNRADRSFQFEFSGKMCVLDCSPNALKMLHNSTEFMPYVVFIGAPGMETLKQLYAERRVTGGSQRNLAVNIFFTFVWLVSPTQHPKSIVSLDFSLIAKAQFDIVLDVPEPLNR